MISHVLDDLFLMSNTFSTIFRSTNVFSDDVKYLEVKLKTLGYLMMIRGGLARREFGSFPVGCLIHNDFAIIFQ